MAECPPCSSPDVPDLAPLPADAAPSRPQRPGPLSWVGWLLFFGLTLVVDSAPYFMGATLVPGMLDDPKMVAWSIVGAWVALAIALALAWRAGLTRRDLGLVSLPVGQLLRWAGFIFAGLAVTGIIPSLILGDRLGVIEPITRPPQGLGHWMLWMLLAATAGVTEEIMMRGYGMGFLLRAGLRGGRWRSACRSTSARSTPIRDWPPCR